MNTDDGLQWYFCIPIDDIRVIVVETSFFEILVINKTDIFN